MEELFNKIKRLREERNLNHVAISKEIGISNTAYSKIEKGITKNISLDTAIKIARVLKVDFNELFEIESENDSNRENNVLQNEIQKLNQEIEYLSKRINELEGQLNDKKQLEDYFKRDIFELRTLVTIWPRLSFDTQLEDLYRLFKERTISKEEYDNLRTELPEKLAQSIVILIKNNLSLISEFDKELKGEKYKSIMLKVRQILNQ